MVKVYGASDDLVEIEGSSYRENEIDCFDKDVRIWFDDGTVIRCGYSKPNLAIWYIIVEKQGTAQQSLIICENEEDNPYSDVFEIDAEILKHSIIKQTPIEALTTQLAEKDKEIKKLNIEKQLMRQEWDSTNTDLARVTAERDAAIQKAIAWGADLIRTEADAQVTTCSQCGFPIPDYGVNEQVYCQMCKTENVSLNYVSAGTGYCKTTVDRKAKTYDKLFQRGRGQREE